MGIDLQAFGQHVKDILGKDLLGTPGRVLYSPSESLSPGHIYILGLNPGGDPEHKPWTIGQDIEEFVKGKQCNAYWNEPWGKYKEGRHPLQDGVKKLLTRLVGNETEARKVCAANLIFKQSPNDDSGNIWNPDEVVRYWQIHKLILDIVRPRLLLTIGNGSESAFNYLWNLSHANIKEAPSGYPKLKLRAFQDDQILSSSHTIVVGVPHLSHYRPNQAALDWIYGKYGEALKLPRPS